MNERCWCSFISYSLCTVGGLGDIYDWGGKIRTGMNGGESTSVNGAGTDRWLCSTSMFLLLLLQLEMPWDSLAARKDQVINTYICVDLWNLKGNWSKQEPNWRHKLVENEQNLLLFSSVCFVWLLHWYLDTRSGEPKVLKARGFDVPSVFDTTLS